MKIQINDDDYLPVLCHVCGATYLSTYVVLNLHS